MTLFESILLCWPYLIGAFSLMVIGVLIHESKTYPVSDEDTVPEIALAVICLIISGGLVWNHHANGINPYEPLAIIIQIILCASNRHHIKQRGGYSNDKD